MVPKPLGLKEKGRGTRLNEQPVAWTVVAMRSGRRGDGGAAPRALCVHTQQLGK